MRNKRLAYVLAVLPVFGAGCTANRYLSPIGRFQANTQTSVAALKDVYRSRNDYELDLYLTSTAATPKAEILKMHNGQPTPLGKPPFAAAAVEARLQALDLIGAYANKLHELATSGAPTGVRNATEMLGTNLTNLDKTFQRLHGEGDPTANTYIGPISKIIGAIGQMIVEAKRDKAIRDAVGQAGPEVIKILDQIDRDFEKVLVPLESTGENQRCAEMADVYNTEAKNSAPSYDQRRARAEQVKAACAHTTLGPLRAKSDLITALRRSHESLVALVNSPRKPANFAEFNASLELWTVRIQDIAVQIRALI